MICIRYFIRCLSGVCPPLAAKRRELQWNSSSAVPSKFSQPGVARDTSLRREKNSLHRSALRGAKPVFARLWRPNGVNLHLTVASRQMNVQPARSGPRHLAAPRKGIPHRSAPRGAKPVFVRLWRTNGVNLHLTVASRQMNVPPARSGSKHSLRREKNSLTAAHPRGAKPVFARLRRPNGVNFNGTAHLLFHQSSASPEWPEALAAPRKRNTSHRSASPGSEANPVPRHGEPLARVPRGETVHWTVSPPLLSLLTLKFFRSLRAATKDSVFGICDFLKKIE